MSLQYDFKFYTDDLNAGLGMAVASGCDVNGDGYKDLIFSAPWESSNGVGSGSVYVLFGGPDGLLNLKSLASGEFNLSNFQTGASGAKIIGDVSHYIGSAISCNSDFNNDGYDDIIIGARVAPGASNAYSGEAYVVFGHGGNWSNLTIGQMDAAQGFKIIVPGKIGDALGDNAIGNIDLNGDGVQDYAIGAWGATHSDISLTKGEVYILFGKEGESQDINNWGDFFESGQNGFYIRGSGIRGEFGTSISFADVNGDSRLDIIVGAPTNHYGDLIHTGKTYVFFGPANGTWHNIDTSNSDGTFVEGVDGIEIRGGVNNGYLGEKVTGLGDINGDQIDDFASSAWHEDPNGEDSGTIYVFFGHTGPWSNIDLQTQDFVSGVDGFRIFGAKKGDELGISLVNLGDINGDGVNDFGIGSVLSDKSATNAGILYTIYGKSNNLWSDIDLADNTSFIEGETGISIVGDGTSKGAMSWEVTSEIGDLNDSGVNSIVIGAPHANVEGEGTQNTQLVVGSGKIYIKLGMNDSLHESPDVYNKSIFKIFATSKDEMRQGSCLTIINDQRHQIRKADYVDTDQGSIEAYFALPALPSNKMGVVAYKYYSEGMYYGFCQIDNFSAAQDNPLELSLFASQLNTDGSPKGITLFCNTTEAPLSALNNAYIVDDLDQDFATNGIMVYDNHNKYSSCKGDTFFYLAINNLPTAANSIPENGCATGRSSISTYTTEGESLHVQLNLPDVQNNEMGMVAYRAHPVEKGKLYHSFCGGLESIDDDISILHLVKDGEHSFKCRTLKANKALPQNDNYYNLPDFDSQDSIGVIAYDSDHGYVACMGDI